MHIHWSFTLICSIVCPIIDVLGLKCGEAALHCTMPRSEPYVLGCAVRNSSFSFELTVYSLSSRGHVTDRIEVNPDTRLGDVLGWVMDTPNDTVYPYYGIHLLGPLDCPQDFNDALQTPPATNPRVDPNSFFLDPIYYSTLLHEVSTQYVVPLEHVMLPRMLAFSTYIAMVYYDDLPD